MQYPPPIREETLQEHIEATAKLAGKFGGAFGSRVFAEIIAKFHDVGKASREFQKYINHPQGNNAHGPDHSTAGAQFLDKTLDKLGVLFGYPIAGHHSGLPDGIASGTASLESRLKKQIPQWRDVAEQFLQKNFFDEKALFDTIKKNCREIAPFLEDGFSTAFWVRMLFSCLVDADYLATEQFMSPVRAKTRCDSSQPTIPELCNRLEAHIKQRFSQDGEDTSQIAKIRAEVRADCLRAAAEPAGTFTLTVPTGGGKTLSSLAFALEHAKKHHLSRVIYAIPFTSIIEQNAKIFREALGEDAVLEHHSNIEYDDTENEDSGTHEDVARLATQNWNSPVVVTTNVQFFESLFSHKPSRCRKLHNIARSVVIFDEVQTLPIPLLKPCLRALDELVCHYGASIVLCTATQPSISSKKLKCGLHGNANGIREIITPGRNLYERLRRTTVEKIEGTLPFPALAERLLRERQVLAIVNTRGNALELFGVLRNMAAKAENEETDSIFHLSAQMCPAHRMEILKKIRERLNNDLPCRVVSTQLIEAGVDIDFPCVYREQTGIDSIAQAAGRCNRNGKLVEAGGRVFIFEPEKTAPKGPLRTAAEKGRETLKIKAFRDDPISQKSVEKYFDLMYWHNADCMDRKNVLSDLLPKERPADRDESLAFKFRTLGESFRFIDEETVPVLIPYGARGKTLCENLRETFDPSKLRKIATKLQPYAVSVYKQEFDRAVSAGTITILHERYAVLVCTQTNYSEDTGLCLNGGNGADISFFLCI